VQIAFRNGDLKRSSPCGRVDYYYAEVATWQVGPDSARLPACPPANLPARPPAGPHARPPARPPTCLAPTATQRWRRRRPLTAPAPSLPAGKPRWKKTRAGDPPLWHGGVLLPLRPARGPQPGRSQRHRFPRRQRAPRRARRVGAGAAAWALLGGRRADGARERWVLPPQLGERGAPRGAEELGPWGGPGRLPRRPWLCACILAHVDSIGRPAFPCRPPAPLQDRGGPPTAAALAACAPAAACAACMSPRRAVANACLPSQARPAPSAVLACATAPFAASRCSVQVRKQAGMQAGRQVASHALPCSVAMHPFWCYFSPSEEVPVLRSRAVRAP
jgi:hypothetical protein